MKFEVQRRVLETIGRIGIDKRAITAERLSQSMNNEVSKHTVPLSNGFFVEAGWMERTGRGEYTASKVLLDYSRRLNAQTPDAAGLLRGTIGRSWFWPVVERHIQSGPAPRAEVTVALMEEAEVGSAHDPQVRMLLEWLRYIGAITLTESQVGLAEDGSFDPGVQAPDTAAVEASGPADVTPPVTAPATPGHMEQPADSPVSRSTTAAPGRPGVMFSFDFSCEITADDLSKLTPDQIKALFEAVGTVMAVKNTL